MNEHTNSQLKNNEPNDGSQTHYREHEYTEPLKTNNRLMFKVASIAGFCICFLIGLGLIKGLVNERQRYHNKAIAKMKKVHAPDQQIITPFILFEKSNQKHTVAKAISPSKSHFKHQTKVTDKDYKIGIYNAISYKDALKIKATYKLNKSELLSWKKANNLPKTKRTQQTAQAFSAEYDITNYADLNDNEVVRELNNPTNSTQSNINNSVDYLNQTISAKLILSITDVKGLQQLPTVTIQGETYTFNYPHAQEYLGLSYVELVLPQKILNALEQKALDFDFNINIKGIDSISTLALGSNATVNLTSNWKDPKMFGITTEEKNFSASAGTNFTANWFNPLQSVVNTQAFNTCINKDHHKKCSFLSSKENSYGIQFIQATNAYSLSDRTIKYALLLLLVIFGAFFLFEVIQEIQIHPIQYSLVGAALLVFYVLVLSLSEQIAFATAYLIAAVGCVTLISWYVFYVLNSLNRALLFAGILSSLYGSFFYIIQSEDNSLIIGSVFMFVMIALAMFFTRHIDWYKQA